MKTGKKNSILIAFLKLLNILFFLNISIYGQVKKGDLDLMEELDILKAKQAQSSSPINQIALEGTIDPEKYFVGPSDKISVNVWLNPPASYNLIVTPEGTLIVPTVGEIKVADKTLAEVKKIIEAEVKKKYITGEITITLIEPRPIIISISGNVLNPGIYTLSSIDRADKALQLANQLGQKQTLGELNFITERMSTRNIILKRRNGETFRIDIPKFLATKEDKYNPYLREGDVVIVPRKNIHKNVIGIYGEVNNPGKFEYVEDDSITDAIKIAHGLTNLANPDSIEFSRLNADGNEMETSVFSLEKIQSGKLHNILLQPGDRIVVKPKPELREDFVVYIEGEVKFPGTYPITKNNTKLSEIIHRAGNFTEYASLKTAELYRRSVSPREVDIERLMSMRGGIIPEDTASYLIETELRLQKEIVNVDFEKLFLNNDTSQDIILRDGDYIRIPSIKNTIYVFGQIVSPGHVPYQLGMNLDYYIAKCGGYTDAARKGDVKIIKNRTKQWLDPKETTIEEGDYIWVPKRVKRDFAYYSAIMSQTASVLSVIVGMALVIIQITRK